MTTGTILMNVDLAVGTSQWWHSRWWQCRTPIVSAPSGVCSPGARCGVAASSVSWRAA